MMDFSLQPPAIIIPAQPKLIVPALGPSFASLMMVEKPPLIMPKMVTQTASNSGGSTSSSKTALLPASIVAGNLLLIYVRERSTSNNLFTFPAGWNEILDLNGTGIAWRQATGSEGASISYTGGGQRGANCVLQISGWASSLGASAISFTTSAGSGVNPDPPSHTPAWTGPTLFVAFEGSGATTNTTAAPAGYSNFQNTKATNDPNASSATKEMTGSGAEDPGIFTNAGSQSWSAVTLSVRSVSVLLKIAEKIKEAARPTPSEQ